jgi:hypothetical protein
MLILALLKLASPGDAPVQRDRSRANPGEQRHGCRASGGRHGFVVETSSAPAADGWYRLEVDRRPRHVGATCGGEPAPGCVHGRWRIEDFGLVRRYLLGR